MCWSALTRCSFRHALTKMWNCPVLMKVNSMVSLSNKVYIVVLSNSHSKIYISERNYFFCEGPVFPKVQSMFPPLKERKFPLLSLISSSEFFF